MISRLRKKFDNIGIRKKILLMTIIGIIIPILIVVGLFFLRIVDEISQRESSTVESAVERMGINITSIIRGGENLSLSYFADERLNELLLPLVKDVDSNVEFTSSIQYEITSKINKDLFSYDSLESLIIYHNNESYKRDISDNHIQYYSEEMLNSSWYQKLNQNNSDVIIDYSANDTGGNIVIARRMNFYDYDSSLISLIKIKNKTLSDILEDNIINEHLVEFYLTNAEQEVIITNSNEINLDRIKRSEHNVISQEYIYRGFISNWEMIAVYPGGVTGNDIVNELVLMSVIIIGVLVLAFLMVFLIAHSISGRLSYISESMVLLDDNELSEIQLEESSDEIGLTVKRYNYLVRKIDMLLKDKILKNKELSTKNKELIQSNNEIRKQGQKIKELIFKDTITGLDNRTSIMKKIQKIIMKSEEKSVFAVVFIDVDNFKDINDTYGHDTGDRIIQITGKRLGLFKSDSVEVGRFGGDEYLLLIRDCLDEQLLRRQVEAIKKTFEEPITDRENQFFLTVSIGISRYPYDGMTEEKLIKCADMALYKAKDLGKNRYVMYKKAMTEQLEDKLAFQQAIRVGIEQNEFYLNFQPIVEVGTERIKGFEALIRWESSSIGRVSPYRLVQSAERTGKIIEIGEWVFRKACLFINELRKRNFYDYKLSVNISAVQLSDPLFYTRIMEIIEELNVDPSQLVLEMTETVLIDSLNKGRDVIEQLIAKGFELSLDDFGTGYSSLSYFNELPLSKLKIDKSFIDKINTDSNSNRLIESIITLAHNKEVDVIAEGVELAEQVELLQELGCDYIQGYYYGKPTESEKALSLLESKSCHEN